MPLVKVCNHGISDGVKLSARSTVEDYDSGIKTVIYRYWCPEHEAYGTHSVAGPVEQKPKI